jgi:hypothetical protein
MDQHISNLLPLSRQPISNVHPLSKKKKREILYITHSYVKKTAKYCLNLFIIQM